MKKKILILSTLLLILVLVPAGLAQANNPLRGDTDYDFMGHLGIVDPAKGLLIWEGTVSGDINGTIKWWAPSAFHVTGQASHYDVIWEILDGIDVLLAGYDSGTTTARHEKNSNWRTNGTVTEANGEFEDWLGRNVHMSGNFTWVAPEFPDEGEGNFRVN